MKMRRGGVTRSIYFSDPDGTCLELYRDMAEQGVESMQTVGPKAECLDLDKAN